MGDMADYFREQNEYWDICEEPITKTCYFCGKENLIWGSDEDSFFLMEGNRKHVCFSKLKPVNLEDIIEIPTS